MAKQIKGDYAQPVVSKCVQQISPCSRTSGKAMQHNECLGAVSSFTTQFYSKPYTIYLHKCLHHIHTSLIAFLPTSQSCRCILTLLVRSVGISITCKPPVSSP